MSTCRYVDGWMERKSGSIDELGLALLSTSSGPTSPTTMTPSLCRPSKQRKRTVLTAAFCPLRASTNWIVISLLEILSIFGCFTSAAARPWFSDLTLALAPPPQDFDWRKKRMYATRVSTCCDMYAVRNVDFASTSSVSPVAAMAAAAAGGCFCQSDVVRGPAERWIIWTRAGGPCEIAPGTGE